MDNCIICPEDQWSNDGRDRCIPRIIELLKYGDTLGATLACASIVFSVMTAVVLGLFVLHQNTPVVRANNRHLSYILLVSLMMSFLCSLLFIGQPGKMTCQLRQTGFGIIFAVAISSVLAKTITVVIAFKATKPGSKLIQFVGSRVSIYLVLVSTLVQVAVCIVWLVHSPPYPDYDTKSVTGKMILLCNEGSVTAFYIVIGYIGFLSALSFLVAFLVRKVPDTYNEAQLITFSMLVFCSVWISFIPAYLSTKGKYTVAVEIFAILASSAGLLGCIFFPKCYIILLRPEMNTRGIITRKH
ncbi:vomeronasal type-2 receptor 26-like [Discoglossus pictus]